ncbi:hypothetical protein HZA97_08855 [Candidatus Woesearchaeota archaeon]|nr:hypothetical protein [Candidatus Woesearchaeota archaeon]
MTFIPKDRVDEFLREGTLEEKTSRGFIPASQSGVIIPNQIIGGLIASEVRADSSPENPAQSNLSKYPLLFRDVGDDEVFENGYVLSRARKEYLANLVGKDIFFLAPRDPPASDWILDLDLALRIRDEHPEIAEQQSRAGITRERLIETFKRRVPEYRRN